MSIADNAINKDDPMFPHQFHWFTGVIEDITDPEQRGRYRVRCFGYHTERKDYIPTTTLPWAHVMMPITSASTSGVGESATGLLRGSWVIGFFRDGQTAQDPIIMGSIPAITPSVEYDFGFCDPVEQYPYKDKVGDQDTPEEAISKDGVYTESFSYEKKEEHRKNTPHVPIALNGGWELPPVDEIIQVEYPKNHVRAYERVVPLEDVKDFPEDNTGILDKETEQVEFFEGKDGLEPPKEMHVQEFDVTPEFERISTMHRTGTYCEWTPKGDETVVIVGNEYRIVIENQHINIQGDCTLTVDGNYHRLVKGDEFIEVRGNRTELILGNVTQTVIGNRNETVLANKEVFVASNVTKTIGVNKTENCGAFRTTIVGGGRLDNTVGAQTELVTGIKALLTVGNAIENYISDNIVTVTQTYTRNAGFNDIISLTDYHNLSESALITTVGGGATGVGQEIDIIAQGFLNLQGNDVFIDPQTVGFDVLIKGVPQVGA